MTTTDVAALARGKTLSRFWAKVDRRGPDECWPWLGNLSEGYGQFSLDNRSLRAHRAAFWLLVRRPQDRMPIDHICRNRACVNPSHLREVTPKTNTLENSVSPSALNARKTHCKNGHEFTAENTYMKLGWRFCRECQKKYSVESYQRGLARKAALAAHLEAEQGDGE